MQETNDEIRADAACCPRTNTPNLTTVIRWHKSSDELPEPTKLSQIIPTKNGVHKEKTILIDDECLVVWNGKVKRSRYLSDLQRWEGHMENQIPEYWIKIKEIGVEDD